jgi:hypothetical protein
MGLHFRRMIARLIAWTAASGSLYLTTTCAAADWFPPRERLHSISFAAVAAFVPRFN